MGTYTNLELTAKGLALEAKVQAGATLVFSRYGLGSGALTFPDDVSAMTALVNEEMSHPIAEVKRVNNTVLIKGYITPDDLPATGFDLTEIGIFATDPDDGEILFGLHYGTAPDNIPSSSSGMNFDYAFNTEWVVQQTDTVTVYVDPTAGATKQDLTDHGAEIVDPTSDDDTEPKHLYDAQAKVWQGHAEDDDLHRGGKPGDFIFLPYEPTAAQMTARRMLEGNGGSLLDADYPELLTAWGGKIYGNVDSTHFNLPDLGGLFPRFWDHGAGVDPDAASRGDRGDGNSGDVVGSLQPDINKIHGHPSRINDQDAGESDPTGAIMLNAKADNVANYAEYTGIPDNIVGHQIGGSGGNESRPKNIYIWGGVFY